MDQEAFEQYLKDRYQDQVDWYDAKAGSNQRKFRFLQWSVIVLSAITPILVLVGTDGWQRGLAVIVAALVAIGTAALRAFKYQENWISYRTTCETLRKEIHYFNANLGEYAEAADRQAKFIERVEALVSRENTLWLSTQSPSKESPA